jgi:hypothetical protein
MITAILEPHTDGSIRLPVFAEIRQGKVKVTATLIPVSSDTEPAVNTLELSSAHCGARRYQEHPDPARWQREIRQDRSFPLWRVVGSRLYITLEPLAQGNGGKVKCRRSRFPNSGRLVRIRRFSP